MLQTSLFSYFKKLPKKQQRQQNKTKKEITTATPTVTSHHSDQSAAYNTEWGKTIYKQKDYYLLKV